MSFYHLNPNRRGERLARRLEQLGDYRVLRRLPQPEEIWCRSMPVPDKVMKLGIVDCETTGLDPKRHKMIELAIGTLSIDLDAGDVVDVNLKVGLVLSEISTPFAIPAIDQVNWSTSIALKLMAMAVDVPAL